MAACVRRYAGSGPEDSPFRGFRIRRRPEAALHGFVARSEFSRPHLCRPGSPRVEARHFRSRPRDCLEPAASGGESRARRAVTNSKPVRESSAASAALLLRVSIAVIAADDEVPGCWPCGCHRRATAGITSAANGCLEPFEDPEQAEHGDERRAGRCQPSAQRRELLEDTENGQRYRADP